MCSVSIILATTRLPEVIHSKGDMDEVLQNKHLSSFGFYEINEQEVFPVFHRVSNKESSGTDGLASKIVKNNSQVLAAHLTCLLNYSMLKKLFLTAVRTAYTQC